MERRFVQRDLLVVVAIAVLAFGAYRAVGMHRASSSIPPVSDSIASGMDEDLFQTVRKLEGDLAARLSLNPSFTKDPLNLARVVPRIYESVLDTTFVERESPLALTAVVSGAEGYSAVIRFKGRSYVVHEGDSFEGHAVVSIGPKSAVLRTPVGATVTLTQEPAVPSLPPPTRPTSSR